MTEEVITDQTNQEYESLNFPIIPENSNFISQDKVKEISLADKIVSVFDIPTTEKRRNYLRSAKEKIRKVVSSIKTLKEQNEKKYRLRNYILDPECSKIRFVLDGFIVTLILCDLVISPFEFFVYKNLAQKNFREIVFDLLFFIEIIANFFTGYYDKTTNQLVTQPKAIAMNYLQKGLIFDVIYTLPFWAFDSKLMLLRFVKIYRYPHIISIIQQLILTFSSFCLTNFKIKKIIIEFVSFGFNVLYILHIFACIYVYIAKSYDENWITLHELDIEAIVEVYISSVYMQTQTFSTTGYGELTPVNNVEMCFVMISQIVCCGLFSYLITCILIIFTDHVDTLSFKYQTSIELPTWMSKYSSHLPSTTNKFQMIEKIWDNVVKYFNLYYSTRNNFTWINRFPILREIKPIERNSLLEKSFLGIISKFDSFFDGMSQSCKNRIVLKLKTRIQRSNYTVIKEGHAIKRLFFIAKGSVYVIKEKTIVCQLKEGNVFGLLGLYDSSSVYSYETYQTDYAHLYSIKFEELYRILLYEDISFNVLVTKAIEAKFSLSEMKEKSCNVSRLIIENNNDDVIDESIEMLPQIPYYNYSKTIVTNALREDEKMKINVENMLKTESISLQLQLMTQKENESKEIEMRLNLIKNQILFLEKAF